MSLLISKGRIAEISPSAAGLTGQHPRAVVVDASDRIVLPGFVNAHFHGESVLLRTITGRRAFASWPALTPYRDAIARLIGSTPGALLEGLYAIAGGLHLQHGTTCVSEFPLPYTTTQLEAVRAGYISAGLRHAMVLQTWDHIEGERAHRGDDERVAIISLGKEEDYTIYSFENHTRLSRDRRIPLCTHIAEQPGDVERLRRNFKKPPLVVLKEFGALKAGTQVIHGNHLGHPDLAALTMAGATLTLCPVSASCKRTGYPLLTRLSHTDVRICIGTDWGSVDMMAEIKLLRMLPNLTGGVRPFSPLELIRMATVNGAHALGLDAHIGSIEVGKKADLILFSPQISGTRPGRGEPVPEDIAATVVDYLDRGSITDVLVDGVFAIRDRRPVPQDRTRQQEAYQALQEAFERRGSAGGQGTTRKSTPLLPPATQGFIPGFTSPGADDRPLFPGGPNMAEQHPTQGNEDAKPKEQPRLVKKVFGENDF